MKREGDGGAGGGAAARCLLADGVGGWGAQQFAVDYLYWMIQFIQIQDRQALSRLVANLRTYTIAIANSLS